MNDEGDKRKFKVIQGPIPTTTRIIPATLPPDPAPSSEGPKHKRRLLCTVENCGYSTPFSKDLARHMTRHTGEKPFKCNLCDKSYSRKDKLTIHVRVHLDKKIFKCEVCEYSTVDSWSLRKHVRVHNNVRPYKCQMCPYAAKESSKLVVHGRIHTGDNPYVCMIEFCDAAFKTRSDLVRHGRIHSKDKPHPCPHCCYKAAIKSNLNIHLRKVHRDMLLSDGESTLPVQPVPRPKRTKKPKKSVKHQPHSEPKKSLVSNVGEFTTEFHPDGKVPSESLQNVDESPPVQSSSLQRTRSVGRPRSTAIVPRPLNFNCSFCTASFVSKDSLRCHLRQHSTDVGDSGNIGISIPPTTATDNSCAPNSPLQLKPNSEEPRFPSQSDYLNFLTVASTSGDGLFTSSYPNLNFNTTAEPKVVPSVITENPSHMFLVSSESSAHPR